MEFHHLEFKNFMSVGKTPIKIDFDQISKDGHNIIMIQGNNLDSSDTASNGAGKSLIQEAITYCLFGRTIRGGSGQKIDDPINCIIKKNLYVKLKVDEFEIIRMRKPNKLEFYENGKNITPSTSTLTQNKIEEVMGINYTSLINIICFGQHNFYSFLDAKKSEKKSILESLLKLQEYNLHEDTCKKMLLMLKKEIIRQSTHYEDFSLTLIDLEKDLRNLILQEKELNDKILIDLKEINNQLEKIINLNSEKLILDWNKINKLKESINKLNQEKQFQNRILIQKKENIENSKYDKKIFQITEEINKCKSKKEKIKFDQNVEEWKSYDKNRKDIDDITKKISLKKEDISQKKIDILPFLEKIKNIDSDINKINKLEPGVKCKSCFRDIDLTKSKKIISDLEKEKNIIVKKLVSPKKNLFNIISEKENLENELILLKNKLNKPKFSKEKIDSLKIEKKTLISFIKEKENFLSEIIKESKESSEDDENILRSYEKNILDLDKNIKKDEKNLKIINIPSCSYEDLISIDQKKNSLLKEKNNLENTKNPYLKLINNLKQKIDIKKKEIKEIKNDLKNNELKKPYYDFWSKGFGEEGIKSYIINQIIPVLNNQTNYWLQFLYNNSIIVKFDKYLNHKIVRDLDNAEFKYEGGSGGENKRIDFAISLAFAHIMRLRSKTNNNILFLDEIADSLDTDGVEGLFNCLIELSKERMLFIITHDPRLIEKLNKFKILTVMKKDHYSYLKN